MKKLLSFFTVLATVVCLVGCFDTQEDITINADGSGVLKNSINMSGLFDMLQMAAAMDTSASSELKQFSDKDIDSSIQMKTFTDTSTVLTADEKQLLKDAIVKIKVNQSDKVFKIDMTFPFKKQEDVQKIMELQQSGKVFNPMKKAGESSAMSGMGGGGELPGAENFMDMTVKNGLVERKLDPKKLDEFQKKEDFKEMKQAEMMLSQITFSTSIRLPKAAKSATGEKLKLSDDKKTATVKYTLADMISNPKALEFKVEY